MIRYEISYISENKYSEEVKEAIFDFLVLPADTVYQRLKNYTVENSLKENIFEYRNLFGFKILRIRTSKAFDSFLFSVNSQVEVAEQNPFDFKPLPLEKELEILNSDRFKIENFLYLRKTKYTYVSEKNKEKFLWYRKDKSVFDFLIELNKHVHNLIDYCTVSTDVHTVADQIFEIEKGVCQDYAHVFISIARENGIPARYVSGYLNQGKGYIGDALMHAWAEALIPGVGWKGFDPTNNLLVEHNYIKVAHGEDYNDCAPIKGVIKTAGSSLTRYSVRVIQEQQ